MHWLNLFSQFSMTIHYIPGKSSNFFSDALLHCPDLAIVIGSVESSLLIWVHKPWVAAFGDSWEQLRKMGSTCEGGFMFHDSMICYIQTGIEVSLAIPDDSRLLTDLL